MTFREIADEIQTALMMFEEPDYRESDVQNALDSLVRRIRAALGPCGPDNELWAGRGYDAQRARWEKQWEKQEVS